MSRLVFGNIDGMGEAGFHRLRPSGIGEELFDAVSGFEALSTEQREPES